MMTSSSHLTAIAKRVDWIKTLAPVAAGVLMGLAGWMHSIDSDIALIKEAVAGEERKLAKALDEKRRVHEEIRKELQEIAVRQAETAAKLETILDRINNTRRSRNGR